MAVDSTQKHSPAGKDNFRKKIMKVCKKKTKKKLIHILHTTVVMEKVNGEPQFKTYNRFVVVKDINNKFVHEKIELLQKKTIEEIKSAMSDKPIKTEYIKKEAEVSKNEDVPVKKECTRVPEMEGQRQVGDF